jgi:hypothetical protein
MEEAQVAIEYTALFNYLWSIVLRHGVSNARSEATILSAVRHETTVSGTVDRK